MEIKIPFLGLTINTKAAVGVTQWPASSGGWWPVLREGFSGAWQRGVAVPIQDAATHPTFWACLTLIASDVAKCRPRLIAEDADGNAEEVEVAAFSPVLRKPNHYQNRIQFYFYWVLCLLTRGNVYALKERDGKGNVVALYLLDPTRVQPMVGPTGSVYYSCGLDPLSGVAEASVVIPAREIIHDRINALYHPLVGLSPVYACGHAALQALTIMQNMTRFFKRGSLVGGIVTAPGTIPADEAAKFEEYWNANYSGEENIGKVAILGGGLKFEKPPGMSAVDSQLIEQLKWDDEKICACLHVPPYMVSVGLLPSYNNVEALGQQYYGQCLQILFESIELCLTEGLELPQQPTDAAGARWYEVEFDVEALDRMDSVQRMEVATKGVVGGVLMPDEGRKRFSRFYKPVPGGDKVYLQKQCWPLEMLGTDNPPPVPPKPAELPPAPGAEPVKLPPPKKDQEIDEAVVLAEVLRAFERAA